MKHLKWSAPLLALGMFAVPAQAETSGETAQQQQEEASIPFVNHGGIRDWKAADRNTLYIQDRSRQWYQAELMSPAYALPYAWAVGFDTGPINRLDRFSVVVVDGERHMLRSLVKIGELPADEG